ncbi:MULTISPECIES: sensor histidine kinase [Heyndrickxia]|uniref:histidine kinase n=1 Tax=Heyndrickxia coagulans DSM 1 = ATCC 7050 TaxID=1121088 RepID=A0A8B4BYE5_HEYCO|nr:HAMP domain-containing sensor histidine kinase [Heyndrickxia coagulans]AJH78005.1 HAMP domain protein [Heyndrickxia coagulans DSM 1 = ATCC 7050]MDR4225517.1 HAMP domain-containing histidine kinase [Heyndrickxia coagulans DSM 1 = ATCC 7050]MED4494118.1 HAMP domain-containing sensor histidine kinase [Heyndrickxia coagulans]MED4537787.1 HAMP domain-containing sensor histidine kinase [Heyndrickxia coagulans]MED4966261.1 HAMP domain-containing sensor histidine kinase [Heyndrickxia coagulans]
MTKLKHLNHISFKIGLIFFVIMIDLEGFVIYFLHQNIVKERVKDEFNSLLVRSNSHRDVLEQYNDPDSIHRVAVMESKSDLIVIVLNGNKKSIIASRPLDRGMRNIISKPVGKITHKGKIIEKHWEDEKYIASVSPFKNGYVYMFKDTKQVQQLISQMNHHFWIAGLLAFGITLILIILLSRILARPLINMKVATKKIAKGDLSVEIPVYSKDELGQLAESIRTLAREWNHLREERSEFLASISHELRTPLTYIKGYADIARKNNCADNETYLNIIYEEAAKLSDMIQNLFDLAKMDRNSFQIQKQNFPLFQMLKQIEHKLSPAFQNKRIILTVKCHPSILLIADPVRFEQVVINLLDNAYKYSEPHTNIFLTVKKADGAWKLIVQDHGKGIPEEDLPYIFERFYRVDKSRSRSFGGTGLGLAIVKEIVEAHNWHIHADSREGIGTTMEIRFQGGDIIEEAAARR